MGQILLMVRKDLRRKIRAPLGILLMLAFPLVFALMLAVTFGGGEPTLPKVRLLVEDRDGELVSRLLLSAFSSEQVAEYFEVEEVGEEGLARMEEGEASALLRIPENFTEDLLRGNATALELVRNPAQQILPEIAEQLALSLTEVLSSASRVLRGPFDDLSGLLDSDRVQITDTAVADLAVSFRRVIEGSGDYLSPPAITLEAVDLEDPGEEGSGSGAPSIFLMVLPGVSVFALFMLGDQLMRDILTEERDGTLRRQLSGPLGAGTVVASKTLHTAVVATISLVILSTAGWLVSERGIDLAGFAVLSLSLILMVTGAAAVIYGVARNESQGSTVASVVYLFLAFVGGSFLQTRSLPEVLQSISPYTPFYWANEGYRELLLDGSGLVEILPQAGMLAAAGLVSLVAGSRLLHRRILGASPA